MKRSKLLLFAGIFTLTATAGVQSNWALEGIDFHDHDRQEAEEAKKCVEFEGVEEATDFPGESASYGVYIGNRCGKRIMTFVCIRKEFMPPFPNPLYDFFDIKYCGKHIDLPSLSDHPHLNAEDIIKDAFMRSSYYRDFNAIPPYDRAKEAATRRDDVHWIGTVPMVKREMLRIAACFYPKAPYAPLESFPDGSYYCVDKDKLVFDAGYHPYYFFPDDFQRWEEDYLKNEAEFQKRWQDIFKTSCPPNPRPTSPLPCY